VSFHAGLNALAHLLPLSLTVLMDLTTTPQKGAPHQERILKNQAGDRGLTDKSRQW
jgi:hypothetical protein